jgi:hypothetical protein
LNTSATLAGAVTVSPLPGSRDASPQTQISFLGPPKGDLSRISVVGSRTGAHAGRLEGYSDGDGASFLPSRPFAQGETVTVSAQVATIASPATPRKTTEPGMADLLAFDDVARRGGRAVECSGLESRRAG